MKFMKLGTRPDSFYTEAATRYHFIIQNHPPKTNPDNFLTKHTLIVNCRTVLSDVPGNIVICIDNFSFLLHKVGA